MTQSSQFLVFLFNPFGRFAFDNAHGVRDRVSGIDTYHQMDMIFLDGELKDLKAFPLTNGGDEPGYFLPNVSMAKQFTTIFWCPNYMIFALIKTM